MLNKLNLAVRKMASTDADTYRLTAINIAEDATEATDGFSLVRVTRPERGEAVGQIEAKDIQAFEKAAGAKRGFAIGVTRTGEDEVTLSVPSADATEAGVSMTFRKPYRQWPWTERIIEDNRRKETKGEVVLALDPLKEIVGILTAATQGAEDRRNMAVRIRLTGSDSACEIHAESPATGQRIFALVMPKLRKGPTFDASIHPAKELQPTA